MSVNSEVFAHVTKGIEQTKKTEMFSLPMINPMTMATLAINGAVSDLLKTNNIKPSTWMKTDSKSMVESMNEAEAENVVMMAGQPLAGTDGATEEHTMVHLMFTKTQEFADLPGEIKGIFMDHIMEEHDKNPATSSAASMLGGAPQGEGEPEMPPELMAQAGGPGAGQAAPLGLSPATSVKQAQVADLQPTDFSNRRNK